MALSEIELMHLMKAIIVCDGYEVHVEDWDLAEELVKRGLITLGPARGPDKNWRRAEVAKKDIPIDRIQND